MCGEMWPPSGRDVSCRQLIFTPWHHDSCLALRVLVFKTTCQQRWKFTIHIRRSLERKNERKKLCQWPLCEALPSRGALEKHYFRRIMHST
eukprot:s2082_g6.t1